MKSLFSWVAACAAAVLLSAAAPASAAEKIVGSGVFVGKSDHITTGGVSVFTTTGGRTVVVLDHDFSLDGAPDPRVGLGKDGVFAGAKTDMGPLRSNTGLQVYVLQQGVDATAYNEVYIWCEQFSVPLGVAKLSQAAAE